MQNSGDAIVVVKSQAPPGLAREFAQAMLALLRERFAHLGQSELTPLWGAHSRARARQMRAVRELIQRIQAAV